MVKKIAKMLKKLNKSGIKFDGKKKFFTSSRRKPISEMDCYNCGELGHLAHQCTKPKKTSTGTSTRARKMTQVMKKKMRRKNKPYKKEGWQEEGLPQEKEEWQCIHRR